MPETLTTEKRIFKIVEDHLFVEPDQIKMESNIKDDLGADSLDAVELMMALEEEFDIEISDDQAEKLLTVEDAVKFVNLSLREAGRG